ncbi:phosphatase PAP2 family protein [Geodermatophilus obscurus]|uniref:Phosphoesterase PA-phosphatase related protein n=1 Tax=Geodermatophilus obscurus (strain ATCC 25078 / DSM 43160 / JCM 3152 / CCUG 61914 / KCC A-0152 / KCTC 9177 / NBRC 13315 / NRRL B-3577 / G-20) TaxID=526225 RepID=D2SBJ3_GEOOG|nr:phosphatase PAP2 family protein [Geodermatophilus obscurus]ADB76100.1 phosphoesterase PA-phosphatase related protein [Geodermatophilus obscurus DSM 43160]
MDVLQRGSRRTAGTGVGAGLGVVLALGAGVLVGWAPQVRLDEAVSRALYAGDDRSAFTGVLLEVLTTPGATWFRVVASLPVLFWLGTRRAWRTAAWVVTANVLVGPLTALLKETFGRVRPAFENGGATYDSLSFPSGHSSGIATLVTIALVLAWPRLMGRQRRLALAAGAALVVLVGLTRMWLGVHFLSDVLGGWAFGAAWTLLVALAFDALPGGRGALPRREQP